MIKRHWNTIILDGSISQAVMGYCHLALTYSKNKKHSKLKQIEG
jgi:predicted DNA-binding protein (MmcQ/YjbR family)